MKKILITIALSSILICWGQSKNELIGDWKIFKVDVGDVCIDNDKEIVSKKYCQKLKGNPDSILITNLLIGSLKSLIGIEYSFESDTKVSQHNSKTRKVNKYTYSCKNSTIFINMDEGKEEFKIISMTSDLMILEYNFSAGTKAKLYLLKEKVAD